MKHPEQVMGWSRCPANVRSHLLSCPSHPTWVSGITSPLEWKHQRHPRKVFQGSTNVVENTWNNCFQSEQGEPAGKVLAERAVWWLPLLPHGPDWTRASGPCSSPSSTCNCPSDCPALLCMGWGSMCTRSTATTWPGRPGPSSLVMPRPPRWASLPPTYGSW